jgi:hypothetical protein
MYQYDGLMNDFNWAYEICTVMCYKHVLQVTMIIKMKLVFSKHQAHHGWTQIRSFFKIDLWGTTNVCWKLENQSSASNGKGNL